MHQNMIDAMEAVQTELGVNPSGVSASVAARATLIEGSLVKITPVIGALTSYTPALTQFTTVAKTVSYCRYQRIGRWVTYTGFLTVTGTGTGANGISVGLPFQAVIGSNLIVGSGGIYDSSASQWFRSGAVLSSVTTLAVANPSTSAGQGGVLGAFGFTAALAAGDEIHWTVGYEATTD